MHVLNHNDFHKFSVVLMRLFPSTTFFFGEFESSMHIMLAIAIFLNKFVNGWIQSHENGLE